MTNKLYKVKRAALAPRTAYMRHKEKDMDPLARAMFEASYYRKQAYEFLVATMFNPDILMDVPIEGPAVVFDVGAYVGDWSQRMWDLYQPTIYAFEPAPAMADRIDARFSGNDDVHTMPYGLGGCDSVGSLGLSAAGSSFFESGAMGTVEVAIRDVVGVLEELDLDHLDVLKVNIEGGEYDLLDRLAAAGWLGRIDHVLVQFHEWIPHSYRRRHRNRSCLSETHEEIWGWSWIWEYWRLKVSDRELRRPRLSLH